MPHAASANKEPTVSRERIGNALRSALRLYVGRGRRYSVKQLSNATGVPDRTIECAMCDPAGTDWRPLPLDALLSITAFLGADFTNEWLHLAEQGAFDLPDDEPSPGNVASEIAEDSAAVVRDIHAGGGADLRAIGSRLVCNGKALVSMASMARAA